MPNCQKHRTSEGTGTEYAKELPETSLRTVTTNLVSNGHVNTNGPVINPAQPNANQICGEPTAIEIENATEVLIPPSYNILSDRYMEMLTSVPDHVMTALDHMESLVGGGGFTRYALPLSDKQPSSFSASSDLAQAFPPGTGVAMFHPNFGTSQTNNSVVRSLAPIVTSDPTDNQRFAHNSCGKSPKERKSKRQWFGKTACENQEKQKKYKQRINTKTAKFDKIAQDPFTDQQSLALLAVKGQFVFHLPGDHTKIRTVYSKTQEPKQQFEKRDFTHLEKKHMFTLQYGDDGHEVARKVREALNGLMAELRDEDIGYGYTKNDLKFYFVTPDPSIKIEKQSTKELASLLSNPVSVKDLCLLGKDRRKDSAITLLKNCMKFTIRVHVKHHCKPSCAYLARQNHTCEDTRKHQKNCKETFETV